MLCSLQACLEDYNKQQEEICAKLSKDGNQTITAICSPLMKRVYRLVRHSAEIAFIDSLGNFDKMNCRIFCCSLILLLVGYLWELSSQLQSHNTISAGLMLLRDILPEGAFLEGESLAPRCSWPTTVKHCARLFWIRLPTHPSHSLCVPHITSNVEVALGLE